MKKVKEEIETLLYEKAGCLKVAKVLKKEIKIYFDTLEKSFSTSGGKDFLVKHTKEIDTLLKLTYKVVQREMFQEYTPMKNALPIALVALGSYGREQLCVYSDIDLMIVYKDIKGYQTKEIVEKVLYLLWDSGLKLGHRVHEIEELFEASQTDITIKSALLESRFIEGSKFIWMETQNVISQIRHDDIKNFIQLKLNEQKLKHEKFPLTMEPNIKDGVGGFRDANLVFWLGKIIYNADNIKSIPSTIIQEEEYRTFRIALEFLFRVRSALHLASNKKEDRLRLELIPKVSQLLKYEESKEGHLKFAKKVTSSLKIIRLYSTIWIEVLSRPYIDKHQLNTSIYPKKEDDSFHSILKRLIQESKAPFTAHPTLLKQLTLAPKEEIISPALYETISSIFYQPYSADIMKTLSYSMVLGYTIEPMNKAINLPQFDGYHKYAVDIHSIECLYHLEHIQDSFIKELFDNLTLEQQALLKIVVFLHDAGKGRKTDHHQVGVTLFKNFAKYLKISEEMIGLGEKLIAHHTLMSNVAQREDLYNQKVIFSFASHFPTQLLLDMIYVLTYADMSGVGGDIYNSFSAKLIKTLYKQSLEVLGQEALLSEASKRSKKETLLKKYPPFIALKKSEQKKILEIPSNLLFLHYNPERIVAIGNKAFQTQTYTYNISNAKYLTIEIICSNSLNIPYILSKIKNIEVLHMDISKLFNGLQYFKIDFNTTVEPYEVSLIEEIITNSFHENKRVKTVTPTIEKSDIFINCDHSKEYLSLSLKCKNQKGLLSFIIKQLEQMELQIVTAKVHSLKNRVRDMFIIQKDEQLCQEKLNLIIKKLTLSTP